MNTLATSDVRKKLQSLEESLHKAMLGQAGPVPVVPSRDVDVRDSKLLPPRSGIGSTRGRARLLHDLANVELQAMELGLRTLMEYPEAPEAFRQDLLRLTLEEGTHLGLCLDGVEELGGRWGDWPVHLSLWSAVGPEDDLIDRVLIVHRYLEGSGLDAGDKLLHRLEGLPAKDVAWYSVDRIFREEIGHVDFGSRWYRELCRAEGLDPNEDFPARLRRLRARLPYRTEKLAYDARIRAGFTPFELETMERVRSQWMQI